MAFPWLDARITRHNTLSNYLAAIPCLLTVTLKKCCDSMDLPRVLLITFWECQHTVITAICIHTCNHFAYRYLDSMFSKISCLRGSGVHAISFQILLSVKLTVCKFVSVSLSVCLLVHQIVCIGLSVCVVV